MGLVLLAIPRDIEIHDKILVDKFAYSGKKIYLNLL